MLLTLIPGEICSLSSWTWRASTGNLSGKSPATDWYNYLDRAILGVFWHSPVQLKLFLKLHRLNKTGGQIIKKSYLLWTFPLQIHTFRSKTQGDTQNNEHLCIRKFYGISENISILRVGK